MTTVYDVPPNDLIEKAAKELEKVKEIKAPDWAEFVKTGHSRERPPTQDNWWYLRTAAIMRQVYTRKRPIGVTKLRTKYGGRKNRGHKPEHHYKGSGSIIRKALQQLTKAGFVEYKEREDMKGRVLTAKGVAFLDKIASDLYKSMGFSLKAKEPQPKIDAKKPEEVKASAE